MPNSVTKRSSRLAILAVVSVIASLFTFALPASAATGDVEEPADWSACVDAATEDAGFTDTAGSFADAWIDCIAHYGITTGTTATTYSPAQVVTRAQMALFLTRAAGPVGLAVPAATDQGFTDIAGLPQTYQDAINQLAAMDISKGTSATTFSPNDAVSRYQMALFLIRFLDEAGVTFTAGNDASGFTDTGAVSFEAHNAIEDAYDAGITTGTSATMFSPFAAVTREQMAAFIGRTLGHTNARPAGVVIQANISTGSGTIDNAGDGLVVQVSVRDASFAPVSNALVDIFFDNYVTGTTPPNPLNADGTCNTTVVASATTSLCSITNGDLATNASGNINITTASVADGTTTTWWAWTGALGATFDADTTQFSAATVVSNAAATTYTVKANTGANAVAGHDTSTVTAVPVKFGATVTVTIQATDGTDPIAQAGLTFNVKETRMDGTNTTVSNTTVTTDATGAASVSLTASDPNSTNAAGTDYVNVALDVTSTNGGPLTNPSVTDVEVEFGDDASDLLTIVASQASDYDTVKTSAVNRTVSATAYDQYGLTMSGQSIDFAVTGASAADSGTFVTNLSGVASFTYSGGTVNGTDTVAVDDAATGLITDSIPFYWGTVAADDQALIIDANPDTLVVADTDNDKLVVIDGSVGGTTVYVLSYDANDQFTTSGGLATYAEFETALAAATLGTDTITSSQYKASAGAISSFTLS